MGATKRARADRIGFADEFSAGIARANDFADLALEGRGETGQVRARLQFKNLIIPEGMGETFQVMVQHKGIACRNSRDLTPL